MDREYGAARPAFVKKTGLPEVRPRVRRGVRRTAKNGEIAFEAQEGSKIEAFVGLRYRIVFHQSVSSGCRDREMLGQR